MSTQPGRDAWRDAGLAEPDWHDREVREADPDDKPVQEVENLLEEALGAGRQTVSRDWAEEYRPGVSRPDLEGRAAEADVVEQAVEVHGLDDEERLADDGTTAPEVPDEDVED